MRRYASIFLIFFIYGNGMVPVVAAMAYVALWERLNAKSPGNSARASY
jgi:hypothetical protein